MQGVSGGVRVSSAGSQLGLRNFSFDACVNKREKGLQGGWREEGEIGWPEIQKEMQRPLTSSPLLIFRLANVA